MGTSSGLVTDIQGAVAVLAGKIDEVRELSPEEQAYVVDTVAEMNLLLVQPPERTRLIETVLDLLERGSGQLPTGKTTTQKGTPGTGDSGAGNCTDEGIDSRGCAYRRAVSKMEAANPYQNPHARVATEFGKRRKPGIARA